MNHLTEYNPFPKSSIEMKAAMVIATAEKALGKLSAGQKVDLLLDNLPELKTSDVARALVNALEG